MSARWVTAQPAYISVIAPSDWSLEIYEDTSLVAEIQRLPDGNYWFGAMTLSGQAVAGKTGTFTEVYEEWIEVTGEPLPGVWIARYVPGDESRARDWIEIIGAGVCVALGMLVILTYLGMFS